MASTPRSTAVDAAESLLRQWIGLDVGTIGQAALERAIQARMHAAGELNDDAFAARLSSDTAERDRLVEEIVVAESWFFRDPPVFDFLKRFAAARAAIPGRPPIRILSVPAAGGEEPYSVAMALLDAGLPANRFVIDAVDVSRVGLARAAAARYGGNAFRTSDVDFRRRWFRTEGQAEVLDDSVRKAVTFAWGNMLDDDFATGRGPYDVVFCRNLLIYLTADARARVERTIDRLLAADGILVLGAAEPLIMRGEWIPASERSAFTLKRGSVAASSAATNEVTSGRPRRSAARPVPNPLPPATVQRDERGSRLPEPAALEEALREAGVLANAGRHADALLLCQRHEREAGPDPQLCFLMGILHQSTGDVDLAEACLHKTLYLDPSHEEALLALSLLSRRRGDAAMAEHYRQSAARAHSRKNVS